MGFSIQKGVLFKDDLPVYQSITPNITKGFVLEPKYIVIHYTGAYTPYSTIEWFRKEEAKASAHLLIDTEGNITQFSEFNTRTWHAGESEYKGLKDLNSHAIGIELVNVGKLPSKNGLSAMNYVVSAHKNDPSKIKCVWHSYTKKQMSSLKEVIDQIKFIYPGIEEVIGHDDICVPKTRKLDPGPAFDWSLI